MLRLEADLAEQALDRPRSPDGLHTRADAGMVYVAPEGLRGRAHRRWVEHAAASRERFRLKGTSRSP